MDDPGFSLVGLEFLSARRIPEPRLAFPAAGQHRAAVRRPGASNHLA